jgi:hypothetical protein
MRNRTLLKLLDDYRSECRLSTNPAHNAQQRDTQVRLLQRMQEWLYDDFAWPHLRIERVVPAGSGQRYYNVPSDMNLERILHLEVRTQQRWLPIEAGIGPREYAAIDSDSGYTGSPISRWRIWEDDRIEVWPVPDLTSTDLEGSIKFVGIRNLRKFVDDADVCDLDDRLIVLYAAAETLGASGAKDAKLKLDQAQKRYETMKSDLTPRRTIKLFTGHRPRIPLRGLPLPRG